MDGTELEVLRRAHRLFTDSTRPATIEAGATGCDGLLERTAELNAGDGHERYQLAVGNSRAALLSAVRTDDAATRVITGAHHDHARARELTKQVLEEARADTAANSDSPMAQREAIRRRIARLHAQRAHVVASRGRALQHSGALRTLHYRTSRRRLGRLSRVRLPPPNSRAGIAVRAALSRLGRPYVWGAAGPNQFDCSGLVKWSYAQAGLHLDRTTYQQIHDGIAVPRAHVRPGDLVFPHSGHVQMAIGNGLVVEAPYAGATVRISPMGTNVAIRRPVF